VQGTGGYAPRLLAFSWLEVGSGKVALSPLASLEDNDLKSGKIKPSL